MNKDWELKYDNKTRTAEKKNGEIIQFSEKQWEIVVGLLFRMGTKENYLSERNLIECCELREIFQSIFQVCFRESKGSKEQDKAFNWMFFMLFSSLKANERLCQGCLNHFKIYEEIYHKKK